MGLFSTPMTKCRGCGAEIPDPQDLCWPCWHRMLDDLSSPIACTVDDCPTHGSRWRRISRWFVWTWRAITRG